MGDLVQARARRRTSVRGMLKRFLGQTEQEGLGVDGGLDRGRLDIEWVDGEIGRGEKRGGEACHFFSFFFLNPCSSWTREIYYHYHYICC